MPIGEPSDNLEPHCRQCGSKDVVVDATAVWNQETKDWELASTFDAGNCNACGYESKYFDWK